MTLSENIIEKKDCKEKAQPAGQEVKLNQYKSATMTSKRRPGEILPLKINLLLGMPKGMNQIQCKDTQRLSF